MKLILFIQTLIIIAGGYYVYLITREPKEEPVLQEETLLLPATTTTPDEVEADTKSEIPTEDVSDNHDQGMEWPTLESGSGLEVR